jgi:hypothetical protein
MSRRIFKKSKSNRGQSFVELMLVALILALMLAGVVEFGFLMNEYLSVLNAAREAARFASNSVAIDDHGSNIQEFYVTTSMRALSVMCPSAASCPIEFVGDNEDDIVISVFSMSGANVVRFPDNDGWSLCANYTDQLFYPPYHQTPVPLSDSADWDNCTVHASNVTTSDVLNLRNPNAPPTGIVLVEIFYNYPQTLGLPIFADFLNPIPVYIYSAMPLSSAEPTPTPRP